MSSVETGQMSAVETGQMSAVEMEDQLLDVSWRRLGGCSLAACGAAEAIRSSEGGGGEWGGVAKRGILRLQGRTTGGEEDNKMGSHTPVTPRGRRIQAGLGAASRLEFFSLFEGDIGSLENASEGTSQRA